MGAHIPEQNGGVPDRDVFLRDVRICVVRNDDRLHSAGQFRIRRQTDWILHYVLRRAFRAAAGRRDRTAGETFWGANAAVDSTGHYRNWVAAVAVYDNAGGLAAGA